MPFLSGEVPVSGHVLVCDPAADVDLGPFGASQITALAGFRPTFDRLTAKSVPTSPDLPPGADIAICFLPRARDLAYARLSAVLDLLPAGGWLVIDGAKMDGVETILKSLERHIPLAGRLSRDHGKTGWLQRPDTLPAAVMAWADLAQPVPSPGGLISAPGMFSAGTEDPGSLALLAALPDQLSGKLADFGAGWGLLSHRILADHAKVTSLDAVEADHASVVAAGRNIGDPRASVHWADVATWQGGPYDVIVMNPPFHTSRRGDPSIGVGFIHAAARNLAATGALYMVANRHLPYEEALSQVFRERVELGTDRKYKIYRATRPQTGRRRGVR